MRIPLLVLAFGTAVLAKATDYYVSPSGNDANSGTTSSSAWRTIDRVNQSTYTFGPGDRVLFQRGGTYRGTVDVAVYGTSSAPFTVGAYGSGAAPVISGSIPVTGWTPYSGNIWKANLGTGVNVKYLYANGQRMTLARYPNSGWLRNDQGSTTTLHDAALTQPDGYWNGATLVVRASNWNYDLATISSFTQGTLGFSTIYDNVGSYDWGYFLRNKLSELDQPGEWYFDQQAGILYFEAPGNADPGSLTVEAATQDNGVFVFWHRSHVIISGVAFCHQTVAGVYVQDADHVTVDNCTFSDVFHGIRSVGHSNAYSNSTFTHTYATAIFTIDDSTEVTGNTLTDVAMVPGLGENNWGYLGIWCNGASTVIQDNHLQNIGYIGIAANKNALVERNEVVNATAILNDGGGISFDNTDGLIVQDNIIRDCVGSLESSAPNSPQYHKICNGIYFGNLGVVNTTIRRNTVLNCMGAGIHVDHTMASAGNVIQNNVLFNNTVQLSISDYSNNNGPAAVAPYYVPNFNEVYSGNVMYCLTRDQLCMQQTDCYNPVPVDYGTFVNNRYFNPCNELSIAVVNILGGGRRYYSLERWQAERDEDANSTRSPLRLTAFSTTQELTSNLVQNGDFSASVEGWTGWPYNATVSHVTDRLDSGALKAYLPDSTMYPSFSIRNPDPFTMENGAWYRVRFSVQSDTPGDLKVALKGESQLDGGDEIWQRQVPFGTERRDLEMYFQSDLSDQALVQFTNRWTEPMYYLDNVQVNKVTVQALDPSERNKLFINDQDSPQSFPLPDGCWKDVDNNFFGSTVTVPAHSSVVAYMVEGPDCDGGGTEVPAGSIRIKMLLGGALQSGSTLMRADLLAQGLIPATEPYTGMGYLVENPGVAASTAVMQATGAHAVVDWVMVEMRNWNSGYTIAGRRAELLRRDGTVVTPDGNEYLTFNGTAQSKFVSVRHRNHLGAMYATVLDGDGQLVDFTLPSTATFGTDAEMYVGGRMALWPGNANGDDQVMYTGAGNDRDGILNKIGGEVPTGSVSGYFPEDENMDGMVTYTGAGNDRDGILISIGGASATSVRVEQLP